MKNEGTYLENKLKTLETSTNFVDKFRSIYSSLNLEAFRAVKN